MSQRLKAKFRCNSITDNGWNKSVNLSAVYGSKNDENADFAKATPSGTLNIGIDNQTAGANFFTPQKDYYLFFEAVPDENQQ
jgi:hypothetical protein